MPNQLADAVVAALGKIDNLTDPANWLTRPKVVRRGLVLNAGAVERPALLVSAGTGPNEDATDMIGAAFRRTRVMVTIYCISENVEDADRELVNLVSDVKRAILTDTHLALLSKAAPPDISDEGETEAMQRSGLGISKVTFSAVVEYQVGSP